MVKSENRDECEIVRPFPIGVDCAKLVHLGNVFFFQTAVYLIPATGVFVLLFSGFVVYFGAILKYMQWLYDTAGKPTVVAIMVLVMNLYSAFSSHTFQCAFYKESIYE